MSPTKKEKAQLLLKEQISLHDKGKCACELTCGGYGLCYAGQLLEGVISSSQVIKLLGDKKR